MPRRDPSGGALVRMAHPTNAAVGCAARTVGFPAPRNPAVLWCAWRTLRMFREACRRRVRRAHRWVFLRRGIRRSFGAHGAPYECSVKRAAVGCAARTVGFPAPRNPAVLWCAWRTLRMFREACRRRVRRAHRWVFLRRGIRRSFGAHGAPYECSVKRAAVGCAARTVGLRVALQEAGRLRVWRGSGCPMQSAAPVRQMTYALTSICVYPRHRGKRILAPNRGRHPQGEPIAPTTRGARRWNQD